MTPLRTLLSFLWAALLFAVDALYRRLGGQEPAPMLATVVPRVRTPIVYADLPAALASSHEERFAYALWPTALPVVCAMMRLECGPLNAVGQLPNCFGFNVGNFDATGPELADASVKVFTTSPEHEGDASSTTTQVHTRVASADLDAGCLRWWGVMEAHYGAAVDVLHGDGLLDDATMKQVSDRFVEALKAGGYFTGSVVTYERAVEHFAALEAAAA